MNFLKGKLTYILAALAVIGAAAGYILGIVGGEEAIAMAWSGLAIFGVRRALP